MARRSLGSLPLIPFTTPLEQSGTAAYAALFLLFQRGR